MARPNRWIDGPCLSTAATRLSRNIAIWKWQGEPGHEPWVKQIVIPPLPGHAKNIQQANSFPPLPLFLKAGHYVTIKRIGTGMHILGLGFISSSWLLGKMIGAMTSGFQ
jgi:hypothetical protein